MLEGEGLEVLQEKGILSFLDIHFARFVSGLAEKNHDMLTFSAALLSSHTRQGHICLDLSAMAGRPLWEQEKGEDPFVCPKLKEWKEGLQQCGVVGSPGEYRPLILDEGLKLYLYRYWEYQQKLAEFLRDRVEGLQPPADLEGLKQGLLRLFPGDASDGAVDMQKVAAFTALSKRFCVISGGPGTGKTTTVAKILALLLEQGHATKLRIALASPTGKGATRMQQAIREAKENLPCQRDIRDSIPSDASTIHRLLGSIRGSPYFRHNSDNPLAVDVLVVDEASMVDLALMSKLVQALPAECRMILMGDKDQLSSVEAGAVLGDICDIEPSSTFSKAFSGMLRRVTEYDLRPGGKEPKGIRDCIVQLDRSYRFPRDSGIAVLSHLVNRGDGDAAMDCLMDGRYGDIQWKPLPSPDDLSRRIRERILAHYGGYMAKSGPGECLQLFDQFRILCAIREGPYGVTALNILAEKILKDKGIIRPERGYYAGKPIMITQNDYSLELFNGDLGVILRDPGGARDLRAFFPEKNGGFRKIHPARLPEHEMVYSMTVHKSQGSEFDRILLILPDRDTPLLTRELVYTAVTRARERVEIWCKEDIFRAAVARRTERRSGLREALWRSETS